MTGFTVRIPSAVARKLRVWALENNRRISQILVEALRGHCAAVGIPWVEEEEEEAGGGTPEAPR